MIQSIYKFVLILYCICMFNFTYVLFKRNKRKSYTFSELESSQTLTSLIWFDLWFMARMYECGIVYHWIFTTCVHFIATIIMTEIFGKWVWWASKCWVTLQQRRRSHLWSLVLDRYELHKILGYTGNGLGRMGGNWEHK